MNACPDDELAPFMVAANGYARGFSLAPALYSRGSRTNAFADVQAELRTLNPATDQLRIYRLVEILLMACTLDPGL